MAEPWEIYREHQGQTTNPPSTTGSGAGTRMPWEIYRDAQGARDESLTGRDETATERTTREDVERQYQGMGARRRFTAGLSNMYTALPFIGSRLPSLSTPEDMDIARRARPNLSAAERGVGNVSGYMPLSRGAQIAGVGIRNAASRGLSRFTGGAPTRNPNLGLMGDITTQGTLGAGVSLADRPPRDAQEAVIGGLLGFGSGAVGPLGTRLFAPSGTGNRLVYNNRTGAINDPREMQHIIDTIGMPRFRALVNDAQIASQINGTRIQTEVIRLLNRERGNQLADRASGFVTQFAPAAVGAAAGHAMGGLPGMLYGAAAGEVGRGLARGLTSGPGGRAYLGHRVTPNMASLLNSVGPTFYSETGR